MGGSACPTRLHLTPWWHGGEARIGRAGRKLLNGNGIKSWSLGTGSAERYGVTSDERRAIVNLPSCRPANPGSMPSRMGAWQPERLRYDHAGRRSGAVTAYSTDMGFAMRFEASRISKLTMLPPAS